MRPGEELEHSELVWVHKGSRLSGESMDMRQGRIDYQLTVEWVVAVLLLPVVEEDFGWQRNGRYAHQGHKAGQCKKELPLKKQTL